MGIHIGAHFDHVILIIHFVQDFSAPDFHNKFPVKFEMILTLLRADYGIEGKGALFQTLDYIA